MTSASDVLQMIKDNDVKFVDLRLTDTLGKEMHVTVPPTALTRTCSSLDSPLTARPLSAGAALKPPTCF